MGLGGGLLLNTLFVRAALPSFPANSIPLSLPQATLWRLAGVLLLLHHCFPPSAPPPPSLLLFGCLGRWRIERSCLLPTEMEEPESPYQPSGAAPAFRSGAGVISSIRMENFMCHSSLKIEFGDHVNFITGQNGSECFAVARFLWCSLDF